MPDKLDQEYSQLRLDLQALQNERKKITSTLMSSSDSIDRAAEEARAKKVDAAIKKILKRMAEIDNAD